MSFKASALLLICMACGSRPPAPSTSVRISQASATTALRTVPETTGYRETSRYADVVRFLDQLEESSRSTGTLFFGSIGKTSEGRDIPFVIASRPGVRTPAEARASGKPVVYIQGNIHAGEVEGKEALQAMLRDLTFAQGPNVLDSIVLIAVPIYNADGNEKFLPQARQRTEQNGPEMVGQRPNAQGLDLNRDYIKAEAPETRASLAMFTAWDPDVFVDLHTTDGSFHGYALTYSPSLNPAAPLGDYTRVLLNELRRRVGDRDGFAIYDYGNFNDRGGVEVSTDSVHSGWYTYDHRPRFGTNYFGLRGRVAILSEAFSHDPFERRVKSTYAFVKQLLTLVAERSAELKSLEQLAEKELTQKPRPDIALQSALPKEAPSGPIAYEILAHTGDSTRTEPGVPRGLRRTGEIRTRSMPVFDRFVPTVTRRIPDAYLVYDSATIARLRLHGVIVDSLRSSERLSRVEHFTVDSVVRATRPFQGHNEVRITGFWAPNPIDMGAGVFIVRTSQPLGRVVAYLLDPESDDSLLTWNVFDQWVAPRRPYPVLRAWLP